MQPCQHYFAGLFATAFAASARFSAHRFLVAAMIAFRPAAESLRFGLGTASDAFLEAAHLLRCASPIRARAAALIFRRLGFNDSGTAAGSPADSMDRSSAICVSMFRFCSSNPKMAVLMISEVSFVGMFSDHPVNAFCLRCGKVRDAVPPPAFRFSLEFWPASSAPPVLAGCELRIQVELQKLHGGERNFLSGRGLDRVIFHKVISGQLPDQAENSSS
jgi:hypothetical protein